MPIADHLKKTVSNLSETPGIYKFYDAKERLLYIGKSKNLKNRVRTYFRKQSDKAQERTLIMINSIQDIQIKQTKTELEALILEDQLIKKYLPPYNVKQKKFREQVYIAITSDKFPSIKIVKSTETDIFDQIFGPFKDKYAAEFIISIISRTLKLRTCSDPSPQNRCILAGIGKCLGPCQNGITPDNYHQIVQVAIAFLKGDPAMISAEIQQQIEQAANSLDFEEAAKLRDIKDFCQNFCKRQKFTHKIIEKDTIIFGSKNTFLLQNCNLIKVYRNKVSLDQIRNFFGKSKTTKPATENIHHLIDRAYVIWVWTKQNNAKYEFLD